MGTSQRRQHAEMRLPDVVCPHGESATVSHEVPAGAHPASAEELGGNTRAGSRRRGGDAEEEGDVDGCGAPRIAAGAAGRPERGLVDTARRVAKRGARRVVASVLRCGPIPEHIAIIMDGNRRWAERKSMGRQVG